MGVALLRIALVVGALATAGCNGDATTAPAPTPSALGAGTAAAVGQSSAVPFGAAAAATASAAADRAPPGRPLNVLLLTIDAMRADMPWQGYERPIAPFLTELASRAVVYTNAYSVSSYTAKSVAALLSGRWPSTLYRTGYFFTAYPESNLFFPELLQKAGIRTIGVHSHKYFDRGMHLEQGFDVWRLVPNLKWHAEKDENVTSAAMTDLAIEILSAAENTQGKFFLWGHYGDPHDQYYLHEECPNWGRNNRERYDAEICFVDLHIKRLLDWAGKQPWYPETAIIIGSDHGELFGEHGQWKHAFSLWEPLVRVPLLFVLPGAEPARIDVRRSYIDLTPTIMELMGQPAAPGFAGQSLVPELYGRAEPGSREPIVLELPADSHNPTCYAMIEGDHKLIFDGASRRFKLFDLTNDPGELTDLARLPAHAEKLAAMKARYEAVRAQIPSILPYGGNKLVGGERAKGPEGP